VLVAHNPGIKTGHHHVTQHRPCTVAACRSGYTAGAMRWLGSLYIVDARVDNDVLQFALLCSEQVNAPT
jgi:hypothetical protein